MTSLLERLTTNAINWDIGRHSALGTQEPQGQAPSLPSRWFKRTEAARSSSPPVTDNHHGAGPRVQLDVAETFDHWTEPREGLSEDSLTNPEEIRYTDGSSFVLDGKRRAGYAVVSNFETIEAKPLPPAVKVPAHDSRIHYSRVKPWNKTEEDTQYTYQPATTCSASSTKI
ncbi:uncharacterized protein LOC129639380 isoform X3 [Bubalus kerabau]|uniref:uncharacterized protein LOC129639380 isoform X3 n=1 Tax=Bubalus carabanensis TaxID=3119969 RepID=UPI00244EF66C|nr:uncharacterized protein LOC129639380 isoform X3 [Bubalus carabanensis]